MSTAGRDQKSAFPSATDAPSEASIRMWGPDKPDAPPLGQLGSPKAREVTVAPVPGVPVCHPYPPFGRCGSCGPVGLPVIAVLAAGPLVRSPLAGTKHLDMPADLPSGCGKSASRRPMLPLWVSFAALWVFFAAGPGRIPDR